MTDSATLRPAENAAVMMMLLDDEQTSQILSALGPDELRRLGEKMCTLGEISPDLIAGAISGFVEKTQTLGLTAHDRVTRVRDMITRAVGEVKASNVMSHIEPEPPRHSSIELARWLTAESLIPLITDEHPQVIAALLIQLDPDISAAALHALPDQVQSDIVQRIATIGPVTPLAMELLEALLTRRIAERHGQRPFNVGGVSEAANIVNGAGKSVEKRVLGEITKRDKVLARRIEEEMFRFEHIFTFDAKSLGILLREVPNEILVDALKGISVDERELFLRVMSTRAAEGVKDEIAVSGRTKLADVIAAQKEIVAITRRLAAEGALVIGTGDGEYV